LGSQEGDPEENEGKIPELELVVVENDFLEKCEMKPP
jgi:hypothetical protein